MNVPLQSESDALSLASVLPYLYRNLYLFISLTFFKQMYLYSDKRMFMIYIYAHHSTAEGERRVEPGESVALCILRFMYSYSFEL